MTDQKPDHNQGMKHQPEERSSELAEHRRCDPEPQGTSSHLESAQGRACERPLLDSVSPDSPSVDSEPEYIPSGIIPRWYPPAPGAPPIWRIVASLYVLRHAADSVPDHGSGEETGKHRVIRSDLRAGASKILSDVFGVESARFYRSGTNALAAALRRVRAEVTHDSEGGRTPVALMSAYTCPDVAVAALRAGFRIVVGDVDPDTLALRSETVPSTIGEIDVVILSNLYGIPEALSPWNEWAIPIIDDASQSALSLVGVTPVGSRGRYGVVSFGRGKALSGIGGGALLRRDEGSEDELEREADAKGLWNPLAVGVDLLSALALSVLARPECYWMPARLPGLGIGETRCHLDFREGEIRLIPLLCAIHRIAHVESLRRGCLAARQRLREMLVGTGCRPIIPGVRVESEGSALAGLTEGESAAVPVSCAGVRFAFRCENRRHRDLIVKRLRRFGASPSYPRTLDRFDELRDRIRFGSVSGAGEVCGTIVTLPSAEVLTEARYDEIARAFQRV